MVLFTQTQSDVKQRPASNVGMGFQYVTHIYKFCGVTYRTRDEMLALSPH